MSKSVNQILLGQKIATFSVLPSVILGDLLLKFCLEVQSEFSKIGQDVSCVVHQVIIQGKLDVKVTIIVNVYQIQTFDTEPPKIVGIGPLEGGGILA